MSDDPAYYLGPRERCDSVWCARWLLPDCPGGADAPGFRGGGRPMLCLRCEASEPPARAGGGVPQPSVERDR